jgi:hypothetical protein
MVRTNTAPKPSCPRRRAALLLTAILLGPTLGAPAAEAATGLYLQLGLGYGKFSGSQLITQEDSTQLGDIPLLDTNECCPAPGLASQLRVGFAILGFAAPEVGLFAHGWNLGSDVGGAGFLGGGLRLYPLKFLSLTGIETNDFPLEVSTALMFGYAIVGKDFAYTGTFWDWDIAVEYKLASFLSAGVKLDAIFPKFSDFVFTSYKNDRGRCLDSGGNQRFDIGQGGLIDKSAAGELCGGRGPSTSLLSPQLVITFHFDLLDV